MLAKLLEQCYRNHQPWQTFYMSEKDAIDYFEEMVSRGNIIAITNKEENELWGYVEHWRINFEQFGRLICKAPFWTFEEDTTSGNIAYVANVWIAPTFRRGMVFKEMEQKFFLYNNDCEYYAGIANRKRTGLVKCFKKSELSSKLFIGAL